MERETGYDDEGPRCECGEPVEEARGVCESCAWARAADAWILEVYGEEDEGPHPWEDAR